VVDFLMDLFAWLDRQAGWIFLTGVAVSLIFNLRAMQRDRKAARRLMDAGSKPIVLPQSQPRVSFLVPAWNEAHNVDACIRSILALHYAEKELVLCAGGGDATLAICNRFAGERVIVLEQKPGEGKQGALRRCFEHSSGEILFLTDADCLVDDACVEATLAPLLGEGEIAVTGYWRPFATQEEHPFVDYQWANHLRYQAGKPDWADTLDGRNSAIRREALVAAGAFQNEAATGTDYVLSQQLKDAGYRIRSVLASRVQTEYPIEIREYLQQGSRWYRNRLVQGVKYRQWRDVGFSLWGAGAALFMLVGELALSLRWEAAVCAWLAAMFHLALSAGRLAGFFRLSGFRRRGYLATTLSFIGYMMVSNLSMVKGLLASFDRRGRKAW
jgi:cellulose synthase/poly-beta-1,6-N-acetylglucosamine synthase-like glycosyltransferase